MIKCRIFSGTDLFNLETDINRWLAKQEDIEILNAVNGSSDGVVILSLFYREPEPPVSENYEATL